MLGTEGQPLNGSAKPKEQMHMMHSNNNTRMQTSTLSEPALTYEPGGHELGVAGKAQKELRMKAWHHGGQTTVKYKMWIITAGPA
eukprot:1145412-Pelagomonas_calceolata.AAC.1